MARKLQKMLIAVMVVALVATQIPMTAFAETESSSDKTDEELALEEQLNLEDLTGASVIESKNTESSTTFNLGNNEKMTIMYSDAVRFKDKNGDLVDYDPSLTEIESDDTTLQGEDLKGYAYTNAAGDKKHYLPESLSTETPALMEYGDFGVSFAPTDSTTENILGNQVDTKLEDVATATAYEDVEMLPTKAVYASKDTDSAIELISLPEGIKENVVFSEKPESNVLEYTLNLAGMVPKKDPVGNGITLYDKETEDIVASLEAPFMNDASGDNLSYDVSYTLEKTDEEDTYKLTVTLDEGYLESPDTAYPVTVDPTVTWLGNDELRDVYVLDGSYDDTNFYSSGTRVMPSGKGTLGNYRTYLRMYDLKTTVLGKSVSSAKFSFYETGNCTANQTLRLYRCTEDWSSSGLTWNNKPTIDSASMGTFTTSGDTNDGHSVSVLTYIRGLASDTYVSHGLCMKNITSTVKYAELYGSRTGATSYRPKLVITYYNKPTAATISLDKTYYSGNTVKVTYSGASSSILDSVNYKIQNASGTSVKTGTLSKTPGTYSVDVTSLTDGVYTMKVWAEDTNGSVGTSGTKTFTIDRTVPSFGTITVTPPTTPTNPGTDTSPTITWGPITEANFSKIQYNVNGGIYIDIPTASVNTTNHSGTYTLPDNSVTKVGDNPITLKVTDKAGNVKISNIQDYYLDDTVVLTDYLPENIALSGYYGKNLLHWDAPGVIPENVYYKVYRSTTSGFTPSDTTLISTGVKTPYFADTSIGGSGTYYYKVKAVKKNGQGQEVDTNVVSGQVSGTQKATTEFAAGIGSTSYLDYFSFDTPVGSGTIEKAFGNFQYSQTDFSLSNLALDYGLTRTYNSQSQESSMLGSGWLDSYHKELYTDAAGKIYFREGDGTTYTFTLSSGNYICDQTKDYELTLPSNSDISAKYEITTKGDMVYSFNASGQLLQESEPNGSTLFYAYDALGRLDKVISNAEAVSSDTKYIQFTYSTANKYLLQSITLPDGTTLSYTYSTAGKLTTASHSSSNDPLAQSLSFDYGYNTAGYLSTLEDGEGNGYAITYEGNKATRVDTPTSSGNNEYYTLDYSTNGSGNKVTTVSRKLGSEAFYTEIATLDNTTGKLLEGTDARGISTQYVYFTSSDEPCNNTLMVKQTTTGRNYETLSTSGIVGFETSLVTETTTTTYNANEDVIAETTVAGGKTETTSYAYNDSQNENDPTAVTITINDANQPESVTNYTYDDNGNMTAQSDSDGTDTTYTYENNYQDVTEAVSEDGADLQLNETQYNEEGLEEQTSSDAGAISQDVSSEYDAMGRVTKETGAQQIVDYTYDYLGRAISVTTSYLDGNGDISYVETTTNSYNGNGSLLSTTSPEGITTTHTYDAMNRETASEETGGEAGVSNSTTTTYGYDTNLSFPADMDVSPLAICFKETKTSNGIESETWMDGKGQTVKETEAGVTTYFRYDDSGNQVMEVTGGEGDLRITLSLYDQKGNNFATIQNPEITESGDYTANGTDSILTKTLYYADDNVKAEVEEGVVTGYTYNSENQVTSVMQDAALDESGNLSEDSDTTTTTVSYSAQQIPVEEEGPKGTETTVTTDPNENVTTQVVDGAGLTITTQTGTDTSGIDTKFTYDTQGNLTRETYADGSLKKYIYDERNLLLETDTYLSEADLTADQPQTRVSYGYDDFGKTLTEVDAKADANGIMTPYHYIYYGYDSLSRLAYVSELSQQTAPEDSDINSHKLTYTYDSDGNITDIGYPLSTSDEVTGLHYTYDQNGRITTVSAKVGSLLKTIREYTYNSLGEVSDIADHENFTGTGTNTVETTYSYDNLGRVTAMEEKDQAENTVESFTYTYDQNSNITSEVDGTGTGSITKEYTYDDLSRLTEVSTENGENTDTVAYTYDDAGNRVTKTTEDTKTTYHYNSLNQLTSSEEKTKDGNGDYSQLAASIAYTYDAKGNELTETETKGSTTTVSENTYTVDSMLSGTTIETGSQTTLTQENSYNGAGQRVSKTENGTPTNYFYQNGSVLYTTGSSGAKTTQNFLTTAGSTMATARYASSDISYYTLSKDIRNSTVSILDETGAVATKYSYDEFGQTTVDGDYTFANEICYTGGIYDWSTGQYYLNARYYDPGTGRFLSEDTYRGDVNEPDTLHLYAYCANNPINYVDPSGHWRGNAHQYITGKAYERLTSENRKYFNLANLKSGSIAPDKPGKLKAPRKYHGKYPGYLKVQDSYLYKAVRSYKLFECKKLASYQLGIGLHTLQDYYAHNVWVKTYYGKRRMYYNEMPGYYLNRSENHDPFDDPTQYYDSKHNYYTKYDWKANAVGNPRIADSIRRSEKYLKSFVRSLR